MRMVQYRVPEQAEGTSVERFLRRMGVSHRVLVDLKNDPDGLTVAGAHIRTIDRLHAGDVLRLCLRETERSDTIPQAGLPLHVVYEDEDFFVIDKPAGMAVHPSPQNRENTVANALAYRYAQAGEAFVFRAIGRLDKNTSGLLVTAKNALSACILTKAAAEKRLFREYLAVCTGELPERGAIDAPIGRVDGSVIAREVRTDGERAVTYFERLREYLAVCTGELPERGAIDAPIGRVDGSVIAREVRTDGERAVTYFERLRYEAGYSLARVRLETGRTHQIRVHMKHIGHPLPGDFLYHPDFSRIDRHALHAAFLTVPQPITGEILRFSSPLPADMRAFFPDWT